MQMHNGLEDWVWGQRICSWYVMELMKRRIPECDMRVDQHVIRDLLEFTNRGSVSPSCPYYNPPTLWSLYWKNTRAILKDLYPLLSLSKGSSVIKVFCSRRKSRQKSLNSNHTSPSYLAALLSVNGLVRVIARVDWYVNFTS
jgi:hypothetical protein